MTGSGNDQLSYNKEIDDVSVEFVDDKLRLKQASYGSESVNNQ